MKSKALIACVIALILTAGGIHATADLDCYAGEMVMIERNTVLWDQPGFSGRVVHGATSGPSLTLRDSEQKSGTCWAKIELLSEMATAVQHKFVWFVIDDPTWEEMPMYCDPKIEGDEAFDKRIDEGRALLGPEGSYWYDYVMQYDFMIQPAEAGRETSYLSWPLRCVSIGTDALESPLGTAYTLVHEACHIQQGFAGRYPENIEAEIRAEKECHAKALEMASQIDLTHSKVRLVSKMLKQDDRWWEAFVTGTCLPPSEVESSIAALAFPHCMLQML